MIVSQVEIDKAKHQQALEALFQGLEQMCPEVIVLMGDYISQENNEDESFEKFRSYFEQLGAIIRSGDYPCLRDLTQWVIMPSLSDPGVCQIMPSFKLSDYFLQGFKGTGANRVKKTMLATNPMRISFRGKELVFARYNYFKKIKKNHLAKFEAQQEKQREEEKKESQ